MNEGIQGATSGPIADIDIDAWLDNHRVNVASAFNAIRIALPGLIERRGTVVNLSSGAAANPMEGWSAYCSAKAALAMIARCVHLEYGPRGVRVFSLAPGLVDTGMQAQIRASGINPVSAVPQGNLAPASDPARAIAWLCTPAADDLAGKEIDVRNPHLRVRCGLRAMP